MRRALRVACLMLAALPGAAQAAPAVTIGDATVTEGYGTTTKLSFPIKVTGITDWAQVVIATRPSTALADQDYVPRLALFKITDAGNGENAVYAFEVPVIADLNAEPTETLTVAARVLGPLDSAPPTGTPGVGGVPTLLEDPTAATGTIVDDDQQYAAPSAAPVAAQVPTTPAAPAASATTVTPPKVTLQNVVAAMPSTKTCASRRSFVIRLRQPRGAKILSAVVKLQGRPVATRSGERVTAPIDLRGLPKGRFRVAITVMLDDGRVVKGTRVYRTCAPKAPASSPPAI